MHMKPSPLRFFYWLNLTNFDNLALFVLEFGSKDHSSSPYFNFQFSIDDQNILQAMIIH